MRRTIWKFPVSITEGRTRIVLPESTSSNPPKILAVQNMSIRRSGPDMWIDAIEPFVWIEFSPGDHQWIIELYVIGTGWDEIPDDTEHIDTIQNDGFVWHIYGRAYQDR